MGADWQTLAVIHVLVGYEADLLGLVPYNSGRESVEGLLITAFIFYTFVALVVALQKFADCKLPEKIITIVNIILLFLAGQNNRAIRRRIHDLPTAGAHRSGYKRAHAEAGSSTIRSPVAGCEGKYLNQNSLKCFKREREI